MKNKILLLSLVLSAPVLADYKITFPNPSLQLKAPVPEVWEPPVGVMSLNPNGVKVHFLDVPANASAVDRTLDGKEYKSLGCE